jgi:hypothetical protein
MSININRSGSAVLIRLHCCVEYQAIELFDRLVDGAQRGMVSIEMIKS